MAAAKRALMLLADVANRALSFVVFTLLDLLDAFLCLAYKLLDYIMEAEWKPCYCSSTRDVVRSGGADILVMEDGSSKILCLSSNNKLHLDDISETLYLRPSLLAEVSSFIKPVKRSTPTTTAAAATFTVNSTIVELLQGKISRQQSTNHAPRWSDCGCKTCTNWISSSPGGRNSLYVHVASPQREAAGDVLFIHGFVSSSLFWTETVYRYFGEETKARYRMFAVDLMGFGRSPKPSDSLYTLREHVEMIEHSVLEAYAVKSLHIVAHSLGSILALALAVKHPHAVKSLTLLAPPYFPVPEGEAEGQAQYVLRKVAPRRVWPPMAFGASVGCWYEHISRTLCLIMCKNHRFWELAVQRITRNRLRTFLMDGFFCHTHNACWHTFHNIICGGAVRMNGYLDAVNRQLDCNVTILHGQADEVIPIQCSLSLASRIPRAIVHIVDNKDHLTIVVGRQRAFAMQLEEIWRKAT